MANKSILQDMLKKNNYVISRGQLTKENFSGQLIGRNAYWKIIKLSGSKHAMTIETYAFVNSERIKDHVCSFTPSLEGKNFIAQAYEYLKTLPEFADAVDC